jgi:DNA-binding HxlR family transcriptional regulator
VTNLFRQGGTFLKPEKFKVTPACAAVTEILSRVGDKWTVLVVSYLGNGPMRFNELRRTVTGISQKMLTTTLRSLERDGFVLRTVYPGVPAKVEYELTDLGRELLVPVKALSTWAIANEQHVKNSRLRYDALHSGKYTEAAE